MGAITSADKVAYRKTRKITIDVSYKACEDKYRGFFSISQPFFFLLLFPKIRHPIERIPQLNFLTTAIAQTPSNAPLRAPIFVWEKVGSEFCPQGVCHLSCYEYAVCGSLLPRDFRRHLCIFLSATGRTAARVPPATFLQISTDKRKPTQFVAPLVCATWHAMLYGT